MWPTFISLCLALSRMAPRKTPRRRPAFRRPLLEVLEDRTVPSTFTVTNTLDDGSTGSLRWAITQVNNDPNDTAAQPDTIAFNIPTTDPGYNPSTGAFTIQPSSALPTITAPVIINGYTQPGASLNTLAVGDNAVLKIDLDGGSAGYVNGLYLTGGNSTVEGLVATNFGNASNANPIGIYAAGGNNQILGNFIGTDVTGTTAAARNIVSGNGTGVDVRAQGVTIEGNYIGTDIRGTLALGNGRGIFAGDGTVTGDTIGGTQAGAANVISGNTSDGIEVNGNGIVIQGNLIGTDYTGTQPLANYEEGVKLVGSASNNTIGGLTPAAANVIAGNTGYGIELASSSGSVVEGNFIGTNAAGATNLGNGNAGVHLGDGGASGNTVGGTAAGAGNVIAHNYVAGVEFDGGSANLVIGNAITDTVGDGVILYQGTNNALLGNSILRNAGFGVSQDYSTNNTVGGVVAGAGNLIAFNGGDGLGVQAGTGQSILGNSIHDNGGLGIDLYNGGTPNDTQGALVLTAAVAAPGGTTVSETLTSVANTTYRIEFFASPSSPKPEGQTLLGSIYVTTDGSGNASFTASSLGAIPAGFDYLTATATVATPNGDGTYSYGDTSEFSNVLVIPVANAGGPYTTTYGGSVTLDASASHDPDGDALTYAWTINGHANAATGVSPTLSWAQLQALGVTGVGTFTASVTVSDGNGNVVTSAPATVTVAKATPSFSLSGPQVIEDGTGHTTLSGLLTDGALVPTGSVTVAVNGVSQTVPLGSDGSFSATFNTAALGVGSLNITYSYGGDANFTAASATGVLDVTYGILALYDSTKGKNAGSVLPVQIELVNTSGQDVSSSNVTVTAVGIAPASDPSDIQPATSPGNSDPGGVFDFHGGKQPFYQFNLKIPDDLADGTYFFYFTVAGDPVQHSVQFTVK